MARTMAGAGSWTPRAVPPVPRVGAGALVWGLAVGVGAALQTCPLGWMTGETTAATTRSVACAEQMSAALETYAVENRSFPRAADAAQLQAVLAPFLPPGVRLTAPGSQPLLYRAAATAVRLRYVAPGGVPVELSLTAGDGGTLTGGQTTVALPW